MDEVQVGKGSVQMLEYGEQLGKLSFFKKPSFPEQLPEVVSLLHGIGLGENLSSFNLVDLLVGFSGLYQGDGIGLLVSSLG